ncbi:MAG: cell division protein FtsL [Candidatus Lambdaproteobacteria bacterium]|nr:cell division protein FtsL [Candidatus Lambdaproteobacteria bacterium]
MSAAGPPSRPPPGLRPAAYLTLAVLCAAVLTFGALFYMWQRYQFIRLGYEVTGLRERKAALEDSLEPLQVEADYLSRLERLDALARQGLGMRPPQPAQVIVVEDHAEPASAPQ